MERTYFVYILASRFRVLNVGVTSRGVERVKEHRESERPSFASQCRIHRFVYFKTYRDVKSAIAVRKLNPSPAQRKSLQSKAEIRPGPIWRQNNLRHIQKQQIPRLAE